jgi:hypothetical protein
MQTVAVDFPIGNDGDGPVNIQQFGGKNSDRLGFVFLAKKLNMRQSGMDG